MTKKKATAKKPTAKKQDPYASVNLVEYGYNTLINAQLEAMKNTWFGERIPTDPEKRADFWKEKLDKEINKSNSLKDQVALLKGMILSDRKCNCDC